MNSSYFDRASRFAADRTRRVASALRRHPWRALLALPVLLLLYVLVLIPLTPSIGDIKKARAERPAVVLSADGQVLAEFRRANRQWVPLSEISPHVVTALLATEDHRFYDHRGIDLKRTGAAIVNTLRGELQGGSSITQQLARNLYPDEIGRSLSVTRKAKEAITALKIEGVYSKDEILETYLNTVPFLYNAFGIEMAARTYFDTSAGKLDELQSATLVGMLKGTSYYNPVTRPERSLERRNLVLAQMARHGKLEPERLERLKGQPLKLDFERQGEAVGPAPHLARQLRRWLIDWADRNGYDIHADGLRVHTGIDSRLQQWANESVQRQMDVLQKSASAQYALRNWTGRQALVQTLARETPEYKAARESGHSEADALKQVLADANALEELRTEKTRLQAGFMALDPRSGMVRAWVGSRGFAEDQFDHVQQARRQPGSTFKPFVYGAAFAQGRDPNEQLMDEPIALDIGGGQVWRPTDVGAPSYAPMSLRDGLAYSKNVITAQLMQRVGPVNVANLARAMGVRDSTLEQVPSLALGTSPVTLKEMVVSYGTIVNGGRYIAPQIVTRVEDRDGRLIEAFEPAAPEPALQQAAAQTLLDVLRGVIDRGTGTSLRSRFGVKGDVAGKTGTTQDNTDGWFILMHPQLVAGAWVGFNDARLTMADSWGQGARSALPIVGDFLQTALRSKALDADAVFDAPRAPPPEPVPQVDPWANSQPQELQGLGVAPVQAAGLPGQGAIPEGAVPQEPPVPPVPPSLPAPPAVVPQPAPAPAPVAGTEPAGPGGPRFIVVPGGEGGVRTIPIRPGG